MTAQAFLKQGRLLLDRGAFEKAVSRLEAAAQQFADTGKQKEQAEALEGAAEAYQALGRYRKALDSLNMALSLVETSERTKINGPDPGKDGE